MREDSGGERYGKEAGAKECEDPMRWVVRNTIIFIAQVRRQSRGMEGSAMDGSRRGSEECSLALLALLGGVPHSCILRGTCMR